MMTASLATMSQKKTNGAKKLVSQIAIKAYFSGEAAGVRLANHEGEPRVSWQRGSNILITKSQVALINWRNHLHDQHPLPRYMN